MIHDRLHDADGLIPTDDGTTQFRGRLEEGVNNDILIPGAMYLSEDHRYNANSLPNIRLALERMAEFLVRNAAQTVSS